jgi:hypothetical protein
MQNHARLKKHVQENKKNKCRIKLNGGYLTSHIFQIGLTHLEVTVKVFKYHF